MRRSFALGVLLVVAGCQTPGPAGSAARTASAGSDPIGLLNAALAGEYDNHEQVRQGQAGTHAGTSIAVPHVRQELRLLEQERDDTLWLWHLETLETPAAAAAVWLYRSAPASDRKHVVLTPYRAIDPASLQAELADPAFKFKFVAQRWAALDACAQTGEWNNAQFVASANATTCSALLPGLGEAAALLPLKLAFDGDSLRVATFADLARGADAVEAARRVRWFSGWAAINGGGPQAKAANQDWHTQTGLRVHSEGGRAVLHWRDGAASGYSLELERVTYPERHLAVLQLDVIEDASGKTLTYVWTDAKADAIGINLGWLQVGLTLESAAAEAKTR